MVIDILITLFLVFLNGFFVAAEFAFVKIRASQLELSIKSGSKAAVLAREMLHKLDAYLSATQLGITIASLLLGWKGEEVMSKIVLNLLDTFNFRLSNEWVHGIATTTALVI